MHSLSRRDFVQSAAAAVIASACCRPRDTVSTAPPQTNAILYSRPTTPHDRPEAGLRPLGLGDARDGFIYVPPTYTPLQASPLLVMLHGAGQSAREFAHPDVGQYFDKDAIVVMWPDSRGSTWDFVYGDYGPDVQFIDRALKLVFSQCLIDPARITLGGFSDGASYALSLGITNASLFKTVLAFSPGFVKPAMKSGKPRIFIGHGRQDSILPIDVTSREIVAALKEKNYPVHFEEFDGDHTVTKDEVAHAIDWMMGRM
jgi:phospholipase/carboxylesterase